MTDMCHCGKEVPEKCVSDPWKVDEDHDTRCCDCFDSIELRDAYKEDVGYCAECAAS